MKTLVLIAAILLAFSAKSQDLIFKMNQVGVSHRSTTGVYEEAVIENADVLITLEDRKVEVYDATLKGILLEKMKKQSNNSNHLLSQEWNGVDDKKRPVQFKFTVNVKSKEAIIEMDYSDYKQYYFGRYNYGETTAVK